MAAVHPIVFGIKGKVDKLEKRIEELEIRLGNYANTEGTKCNVPTSGISSSASS
jgi:hypothetical protein